MPEINVYNQNREVVGKLQLSDDIFAVPVKEYLYWEIVRMQLAKRRACGAASKDRGEVTASTIKPFRQKGTGRARQGSRKSPVMRGGGVVFGPRPRGFTFSVPKKVRKGAVRSALSSRLLDARLIVLDSLNLEKIKTKQLVDLMKRFDVENALIIDERNENLMLSARNLHRFKFLPWQGLNLYDILRYDFLIVTQKAVERIEGVYKS